ncbi:unnamed protein product [Arctia plantaginis]|uniref:Uncharacterized protein n=1 Tax=Arctia plantaginis TaxID=874455 RepID=A0A8S0ZMY6_ARCPL|nr:unnamed protein product [Arctia plantaginis]
MGAALPRLIAHVSGATAAGRGTMRRRHKKSSPPPCRVGKIKENLTRELKEESKKSHLSYMGGGESKMDKGDLTSITYDPRLVRA